MRKIWPLTLPGCVPGLGVSLSPLVMLHAHHPKLFIRGYYTKTLGFVLHCNILMLRVSLTDDVLSVSSITSNFAVLATLFSSFLFKLVVKPCPTPCPQCPPLCQLLPAAVPRRSESSPKPRLCPRSLCIFVPPSTEPLPKRRSDPAAAFSGSPLP